MENLVVRLDAVATASGDNIRHLLTLPADKYWAQICDSALSR